jgi:hypothetical protein
MGNHFLTPPQINQLSSYEPEPVTQSCFEDVSMDNSRGKASTLLPSWGLQMGERISLQCVVICFSHRSKLKPTVLSRNIIFSRRYEVSEFGSRTAQSWSKYSSSFACSPHRGCRLQQSPKESTMLIFRILLHRHLFLAAEQANEEVSTGPIWSLAINQSVTHLRHRMLVLITDRCQRINISRFQ